MSEFSIKLQKIKKSYSNPVLLDVNLEINSNSFAAIIGKSGAGKSTLMNILGLIESFDEGKYLFDGVDIDCKKDYSDLRLKKIGFIFQNYNLISTMTCRENILLPTIYCDESNADLDALACKLDIKKLLDTPVNVLSGGEKQRVAIARALILKPKVIIADEPTGNLDEMNKKIVLDLLSRINKNGCAVIIVTHDLTVAEYADKVYELRQGILVERVK